MVFGLGRPPTPNPISTITVPGTAGCVGLVASPGVRVEQPLSATKRHLQADLQEIVDWGASGVLCLVEPHELEINRVTELPARVQAAGMWWRQIPIVDMDIPTQEFEDEWAFEGERIRHGLRIGERVVMHCYAGLGRTGMMAARVLVEFGVPAEEAIRRVRADNRRRIQTRSQANFVRNCFSLVDH